VWLKYKRQSDTHRHDDHDACPLADLRGVRLRARYTSNRLAPGTISTHILIAQTPGLVVGPDLPSSVGYPHNTGKVFPIEQSRVSLGVDTRLADAMTTTGCPLSPLLLTTPHGHKHRYCKCGQPLHATWRCLQVWPVWSSGYPGSQGLPVREVQLVSLKHFGPLFWGSLMRATSP